MVHLIKVDADKKKGSKKKTDEKDQCRKKKNHVHARTIGIVQSNSNLSSVGLVKLGGPT